MGRRGLSVFVFLLALQSGKLFIRDESVADAVGLCIAAKLLKLIAAEGPLIIAFVVIQVIASGIVDPDKSAGEPGKFTSAR